MLTNKAILSFFLKSMGLYVGFVVLAMILQFKAAYTDIFVQRNHARFADRFANTKVQVEKSEDDLLDVTIHLDYFNAKSSMTADYQLDAWFIGFIPKLILLALVLATRFYSYVKKAIALLLGILITDLGILFILYNRIYILKIKAQLGLDDYKGNAMDKLMVFFHNNVTVYGWICYVLPVLVWFVVSFSLKKIAWQK